MSVFNESVFVRKLAELNNSQQSIQKLSLWLSHHRKFHSTIVAIWFRELLLADESKKLTFIYLANDVIQNTRKKGSEFSLEFGYVMQEALADLCSYTKTNVTKSLDRLLDIWEEREVFNANLISKFRKVLDAQYEKKRTKIVSDGFEAEAERYLRTKLARSLENQVSADAQINVFDIVEFIQLIQELEDAPSCDAATREQISKLPPEISEVPLLSRLTDKQSALKLLEQVNIADELLTDYNRRLTREMESRDKLVRTLGQYRRYQKDLLAQSRANLKVHRETLKKARDVRNKIATHVQNLPDLTQLPIVVSTQPSVPSRSDVHWST